MNQLHNNSSDADNPQESLNTDEIRLYSRAIDEHASASLSDELRAEAKEIHDKFFALSNDQFREFISKLSHEEREEVKLLMRKLPKKDEEGQSETTLSDSESW